MPSPNNLRIIHTNLIDLSSTAITASSGSTSLGNLKLDTKSKTWRSTTGTQASLIVDFGSQKTVGGVVLSFTNLASSTATITLVGYNSPNVPSFTGTSLTTGVSAAFNTGAIACCPWNSLALPAWGTNPAGSSNYSYGGGVYARAWVPLANQSTLIRYLGIQISDPGNTAGYIEISRLIVGNYWSPVYNPGFGIESGILDLSQHTRTESGDLITKRGPRSRKLNFDMQWLNPADRKEITRIFLGNGMSKPLYVSVFPDSSGTDEDFQREDSHQLYGKFNQIAGVLYDNPFTYSTRMELEEV
jgi:hypothetical protein